MEKEYKYAALLIEQISEMFNEGAENFIDVEELQDEEKATAFFHALSNIVPDGLYNKFTGESKNLLEFNHIANQLVFQFAKSEK